MTSLSIETSLYPKDSRTFSLINVALKYLCNIQKNVKQLLLLFLNRWCHDVFLCEIARCIKRLLNWVITMEIPGDLPVTPPETSDTPSLAKVTWTLSLAQRLIILLKKRWGGLIGIGRWGGDLQRAGRTGGN